MRRILPFQVILYLLFWITGCATYRLQYEESFLPIEVNQTALDEHPPYLFYYEESYSKPAWFTWGCGLTFWYYGGICWFHHMSHQKDVDDIRDKGHKKLKSLLANKKIQTTASDVTNFKSVNRNLPPRLRVFDPEGSTIIRGEAKQIQSVPPEIWMSKSKKSQISVNDQQDKVYLSKEEPDANDSSFSFRSMRLGIHSGNASVRSQITENGYRSTIAAGSMPFQMVDLRTHVLPKNGWFWAWAPNLSSQTLQIKDFTNNLPLFQSSTASDIPVIISSPKDTSVIPYYVNTYKVGLQTSGLMLGGGISRHWKLKGDSNFLSFSATGWVSALDYMQTRVQYDAREVRRSYFAVLQSYQLDVDAYYNILDWRLAIGFHSIGRISPAVRMPDDLEFRGPARYDSNKQVFERPRMFIDELEVSSRTFGISLSYIFEEYNFND